MAESRALLKSKVEGGKQEAESRGLGASVCAAAHVHGAASGLRLCPGWSLNPGRCGGHAPILEMRKCRAQLLCLGSHSL